MKNVDPTTPHEAPVEALVPPLPTDSVLGSDPFAGVVDVDPFQERLDARGLDPAPRPRPVPRVRPVPERARREERKTARPAPAPLQRRRWATTPSLAEIEAPEVKSWIDRLLSENERHRLAALTHLADSESSYDRYGFSPQVAKLAFPLFYALYRFYFRVRSEGHENIPSEGPAVLAANHGGLLPFDAAMSIIDVISHTDPPRLVRSIVDLWAGRLPWINVFFARVGQVIGTRENFADLLDSG